MKTYCLPFRLCLLLLLLLTINACSDDNATHVNVEPEKDHVVAIINHNDTLTVTSIDQALFQGRPALVINFSVPLDALRSYGGWLTVYNEDRDKVSGDWILSDDGKRLYFTQINPRSSYTVNVKAGLPANNTTSLQQGTRTELTVNNLPAVAGFSGKGSIIPAGTDAGLPIRTINVATIQVDYF